MKTHNIKTIAVVALCIILANIHAHASDFETCLLYTSDAAEETATIVCMRSTLTGTHRKRPSTD